MIFANRDSTTSRTALISKANSPLIEPEKTCAPGAFDIKNGSPVK